MNYRKGLSNQKTSNLLNHYLLTYFTAKLLELASRFLAFDFN
jgi:hypothetical protein